ncbi:MAG TPA: hypothetical protein VEC37_12105 [Bacillota bacterium]|nr:hypothetical protein [Bacillota bacterium]
MVKIFQISKFHKNLSFYIILPFLIGLFGVTCFTVLRHFGVLGPNRTVWIAWLLLSAYLVYSWLSMPYCIMVKEGEGLEFQSLIGKRIISFQAIISLRLGTIYGRLIYLNSEDIKLRMFPVTEFRELVAIILKYNPDIRLIGLM